MSCTAERSEMRPDPALRVCLGIQELPMLPSAAKLTKKSMPTWLCALSWDAKCTRLCVLSWLLSYRAAGVEMHSQMGEDLPLRAVLGISCCAAPLNGTRNCLGRCWGC